MGGAADDGSFSEFAHARLAALLRYAYLLCGDSQAAEEAVQAALTRTYALWSGVRSKGSPETYVRRAIANAFFNRWRRPIRENPVSQLPEDPISGEPERLYDERTAMWSALAKLPQRQRAVLVLRYYEDLTEAEIATVLHCSRGTVKSQAARGLEKLGDILRSGDEERVRPA